MPQIPDAFILASKHKHARALQKVLPPMDEKDRAEFQHEFKVLWRGVSSERTMCFRDEDGQLRKGQIRQWKADKAPREWQGNPGWNACITSGRGTETQAVRQTIRDRIKDQLEAYANADPQNRSSKLLPRVPMEVIAKWAADDIRGRPLQAKTEVIPEPLKARITKGEHLAYFAAMPLQKDAWRTLVEKEEFSSIGEPLSEQHLIAIDQGTASLLSAVGLGDIVFHKWVSGDYSAATDGLSLAISQIAMEEYLRARGIPFGSDLWEIATKVLGADEIHYGKDDPKLSAQDRAALPDSYVMKNGQLMGSPLVPYPLRHQLRGIPDCVEAVRDCKGW